MWYLRDLGLTRHSPEYVAWIGIKQRCLDPKCRSYKDYGERGITICRNWEKSFRSFFKHVGPRPSPAHSLGRIDNNRNYEPGNVRWETTSQQSRNKSTTNYLTLNGITRSRADWSDLLGLGPTTVKNRLIRGWSIEKALTTPSIIRNETLKTRLTYQGATRTLDDWATLLGLAPNGLRHRFKRGWSVEKALSTPCLTQFKQP